MESQAAVAPQQRTLLQSPMARLFSRDRYQAFGKQLSDRVGQTNELYAVRAHSSINHPLREVARWKPAAVEPEVKPE